MLEGFNFRIIWEYMPFFLEGLRNTTLISMVSIFLALLMGIFACAGRLSGSRLLRGVSISYIEIIRSTPLLVQIYFFYFGLPTLGIRIPELQTGILALMLNSGAYMAEIIRAGIVSVPGGQIEVKEKHPFDGPLVVAVGGTDRTLGRTVANQVFVQQLNKGD